MNGTSHDDEAEEIHLTLPARVQYARVARLTVTGLASRMGFTYDEIEDLRIAVGEMCGLLLDDGPGRLSLRCQLSQDLLVVEANRQPTGDPVELTELSRQILAAVVDQFDMDADAAFVRVAKRHHD